VREGICALLGLESDMIMVGDAGDLDTGIELVREHNPDLVICDLTMPAATVPSRAQLCRECPTMRVLVLSALDSLECIRESSRRRDRLCAQGRVARGSSQRCAVPRSVPRYCLGVTVCYAELAARSGKGAARRQFAARRRKTGRSCGSSRSECHVAYRRPTCGEGVKVVEKYRANLMHRLT